MEIMLNYSAAEINAAIVKINSLISVIEGNIVQLYNGTAIYPITKAEAVLFDDGTNLITKLEAITIAEYEIIKDSPTAYLKNVKYGKGDKSTYISDYINSHNLDKPLPIEVKEGTVIYPNPKTHVPAEELTIKDNLAYNFIPGRCYYFKDESESLMKTIAPSRRFIWADEARNIRDFGGLMSSNGTEVRYNSIFRGSEIVGRRIPYSQDTIDALHNLGVDVDLDLREPSEVTYRNPLAVEYVNIPFIHYHEIRNISSSSKVKVKEAFEAVAIRVLQGKKIYIHCVIGFHRCGLLSTIIAGVLGVPQGELDKDYELSSFSELAIASRLDWSYASGIEAINTEYNGSWEEFVLACGVSASLLADFKEYMLLSKQVTQDSYIEITYEDLRVLVYNKSLSPGRFYRIIDYETLIDSHSIAPYGPEDEKVQSLRHPFDLVVQAVSESELSVWAHALHSKRDVEGYFTNEDLSKWVIKYDLFNDKDKYEWALLEGKGVIFYMKDAYGNEAGYDFKNIAFKHKGSYVLSIPRFATNVSFEEYMDIAGVRKLNFNIIADSAIATHVRLGKNTFNIVLEDSCSSVEVGDYCSDILLQNADLCKVGKSCSNISITGQAYSVTIGEECSNIKVSVLSTEKALIIESFTHDKEGAVLAEYTKLENGINFNTELTPLDTLTKLVYTDGMEKNLLITGELTQGMISNREHLQSVEVGLSITSIDDYTFFNCVSLTSITLPESLTTISGGAFGGCIRLTSINFSEGLISIGYEAFRGCSRLMSVTIPESVAVISGNAFAECDLFFSIVLLPTTPPFLGDRAIPSTIGRIAVPVQSIEAYKTASGWSEFADKIEAL